MDLNKIKEAAQGYEKDSDKDVAFFCEYFSARPVASSQITKNSSL